MAPKPKRKKAWGSGDYSKYKWNLFEVDGLKLNIPKPGENRAKTGTALDEGWEAQLGDGESDGGEDVTTKYFSQLQSMHAMGFNNYSENIAALIATNGDLERALDTLLGN